MNIERIIFATKDLLKNTQTLGHDDIERILAYAYDMPWSKGHKITDFPVYPSDWIGPISQTGYSVKSLKVSDPFTKATVMVKATTRFIGLPQIMSGRGFHSAPEAGKAFLNQWADLIYVEKKTFSDHRTILLLYNKEYTKLSIHEEHTPVWDDYDFQWVYDDPRNVYGYAGTPAKGKQQFSIQLNDNRLHYRINIAHRTNIDLRTDEVFTSGERIEEAAKATHAPMPWED